MGKKIWLLIYGCLPYTWGKPVGSQFRQMVSKIQDLEISSRNRFCHLYKSLLFTEKRPWSWYQGWLLRNGTRISVWNIPSGKTGLPFQMFRCSWKLSAGTTQNVLFHLLYPNGFFRNFLYMVNVQPMHPRNLVPSKSSVRTSACSC